MEIDFVTGFRNLAIILLVWSAFWFLRGFFREIWRAINRKREESIMLSEFKEHTINLTGKEIEALMKCIIITKNRLGGMSFPIPPDVREKIEGNDIENLWLRLNRKLRS